MPAPIWNMASVATDDPNKIATMVGIAMGIAVSLWFIHKWNQERNKSFAEIEAEEPHDDPAILNYDEDMSNLPNNASSKRSPENSSRTPKQETSQHKQPPLVKDQKKETTSHKELASHRSSNKNVNVKSQKSRQSSKPEKESSFSSKTSTKRTVKHVNPEVLKKNREELWSDYDGVPPSISKGWLSDASADELFHPRPLEKNAHVTKKRTPVEIKMVSPMTTFASTKFTSDEETLTEEENNVAMTKYDPKTASSDAKSLPVMCDESISDSSIRNYESDAAIDIFTSAPSPVAHILPQDSTTTYNSLTPRASRFSCNEAVMGRPRHSSSRDVEVTSENTPLPSDSFEATDNFNTHAQDSNRSHGDGEMTSFSSKKIQESDKRARRSHGDGVTMAGAMGSVNPRMPKPKHDYSKQHQMMDLKMRAVSGRDSFRPRPYSIPITASTQNCKLESKNRNNNQGDSSTSDSSQSQAIPIPTDNNNPRTPKQLKHPIEKKSKNQSKVNNPDADSRHRSSKISYKNEKVAAKKLTVSEEIRQKMTIQPTETSDYGSRSTTTVNSICGPKVTRNTTVQRN